MLLKAALLLALAGASDREEEQGSERSPSLLLMPSDLTQFQEAEEAHPHLTLHDWLAERNAESERLSTAEYVVGIGGLGLLLAGVTSCDDGWSNNCAAPENAAMAAGLAAIGYALPVLLIVDALDIGSVQPLPGILSEADLARFREASTRRAGLTRYDWLVEQNTESKWLFAAELAALAAGTGLYAAGALDCGTIKMKESCDPGSKLQAAGFATLLFGLPLLAIVDSLDIGNVGSP